MQDSCDIRGGLLVHSNLTMSLDVRPKRVACPLSSLDGDRILLAEDNGGIGEGGGVSSICSCDTDHSVQIDWPVFVEPNCLPVTTSFRPDAQVSYCVNAPASWTIPVTFELYRNKSAIVLIVC